MTSPLAAPTPLPAHVYAPYYETYLAPNTPSLTATAQASGAQYFTLAFLQSTGKHSCSLYWNGNLAQPLNYYNSDIASLRALGGDVIPSFGGYSADPGGPQKTIEPTVPDSIAVRNGLPSARRCRCPANSSSDRGRLRAAAGARRMLGEERGTCSAPRSSVAARGAARTRRAPTCVRRAPAALDKFQPLDHRMKETGTAWQLRQPGGEPTVNDHTDAAYDAAVLDRLAGLHADAMAWLEPLVSALGRLGSYTTRFERALALARDGAQRFVASPRVDSYHSVWFELHEDLIRLAGRRRADEAEAGRA